MSGQDLNVFAETRFSWAMCVSSQKDVNMPIDILTKPLTRFIAQLTITRFRGDMTFNFLIRVFSTFVGGVIGMVMW